MDKNRFTVALAVMTMLFMLSGCVEAQLDDLEDVSGLQLPAGVYQPASNLDIPPKKLLAKLFQENGIPLAPVLNFAGINADEAAQYIWLSHYIHYKLKDLSTSTASEYWNLRFFGVPTIPFYIGIKFSKNRDEQEMIIIYDRDVTRISEKLPGADGNETPAMYIYNDRLDNFKDNLYYLRNNIYFYVPKEHPLNSICADNQDEMFSFESEEFLPFREKVEDLESETGAEICAIQHSIFFCKDYKGEVVFSYDYSYFTISPNFSGWEEEREFHVNSHNFASYSTTETHLTGPVGHLLGELLFKIYFD